MLSNRTSRRLRLVLGLFGALLMTGCGLDASHTGADANADSAESSANPSETTTETVIPSTAAPGHATPKEEEPNPTESSATNSGEADSSTSESSDASADAAASDVEFAVESVNAEQYAAQIAASNGKVVLVDFWATWCPPCMEQFTHTLELAAKYPEDQLQVITLSADKPEDHERVLNFLRKKNATASKNLVTALDLNETFEQFDVRGGIPYYKLYDRQGKLRYEFNGTPGPDDNTEPIENIEVRLKELLDETAAG